MSCINTEILCVQQPHQNEKVYTMLHVYAVITKVCAHISDEVKATDVCE